MTLLQYRHILSLVVMTACLFGCQEHSAPLPVSWQTISGREVGRVPLYRAIVPQDWIRKEPLSAETLADTTKANCEFLIREGEDEIRVTVHTFPFIEEQQRIPPQAQVARWKKQLIDLDPLSVKVNPESHGGFSGLYFEGVGKQMVMGWSMRLASVYVQRLSTTDRLADYTIKVTGSPSAIQQNYQEIFRFGQSFELIDELPSL